MPYNHFEGMPWGRPITKHVSKRTTSVVTTVTTHLAQQPIVSFTSSSSSSSSSEPADVHPPLVCAPGMLQYNATLCMPCPPGWKCVYGIPAPCPRGSWSARGHSACLPCADCPNGTRVLVPCGGPDEGLCHACPAGFALNASTDTCIPPSLFGGGGAAYYSTMLDPTVAAIILIVLMMEVAYVLCCWRWCSPSSYKDHASAYDYIDDLTLDHPPPATGRGARSGNRISSKRWAWLRGANGGNDSSAERMAAQGRGTGFEPLHAASSGGKHMMRQESNKELLRACSWFDPRNLGPHSFSGSSGKNNDAHHGDEATMRLINHPPATTTTTTPDSIHP